jgi:hypothetical protein
MLGCFCTVLKAEAWGPNTRSTLLHAVNPNAGRPVPLSAAFCGRLFVRQICMDKLLGSNTYRSAYFTCTFLEVAVLILEVPVLDLIALASDMLATFASGRGKN